MKKGIIVIILLIGLAGWQCSKIENRPDLKQSIQNGVENINAAIAKISSTKGYQLISVSDDGSKAGDCKSIVDTITMDLIKGIYDYQPSPLRYHHFFFPVSFFKKTGESDHMIVNMPHRLMFRPKYLLNYCTCDTVKENNFKIDASDYHLYYGNWNSFDYKLAAGFTYDKENIGDCDITSLMDPEEGRSYSSKYNFTEGYSITVDYISGETSQSSFALNDEDDVLLKETRTVVRTGFKQVERQYILSIGNVDIKRSTDVDSIQVFLDGVLQKKAAVKIIDEGIGDMTICHSRDLKITYDDGTTANLSELIKPARETLRSLVDSLGEMYFAKHIIDYIAVSIYFNTP